VFGLNKKTEKLFKKELSQIKNVYLVFGSENYLLDKFEKEFKDRYIDETVKGFNLSYVEEQDGVFKNIINKGSTLPIMSEKRFIIVKAGNIFKRGILNWEKFKDYLKDIPETTVLLILVNKDISTNKRKNIIEKYGDVINLKPPRYQDLNKWIKMQFEEKNKDIGYKEIRLLEKMFSNNLQQLDSEIDKICTFVDQKSRVKTSDIKAVITKDRTLKDNIIFEFLDAFSNKKTKKSVYLFNQMIASGEAPQLIFAMIIRRTRLMILIKDFKKSGKSPKAIAKKIGEHPYPVKKIYGYVDNYSFDELKDVLDNLLKADVKLKTGEDKIEDSIQHVLVAL